MEDNRTLKDLANEVLNVQNACNLSGVIHSWSRSIKRLRELLPSAGTYELNEHPINKLWADKVSSLAQTPVCFSEYGKIYEAVCRLTKGEQ